MPASAAAYYAAALLDTCRISRAAGMPAVGGVRCRILGYGVPSPNPAQGDQTMIVLKADCDGASFVPMPSDRVTLSDGRFATVVAVDANSRKAGSALLAYLLTVRGI